MNKERHQPKTAMAPSQLSVEFRRLAHERLDEIFNSMEAQQEYGKAGVEVFFERGQANQIRRTLDGTDRPGR